MNIDIKEAHRRMLYLLQSFDTVCKKHDIDYWLDYGTLLGAIRHQGFIPWDTDTDVGMLRSDYALFLEKGVPELPQDIFLSDSGNRTGHGSMELVG